MTECAICYEVVGAVNSMTTECGHLFHANCMLNCITKRGICCPICRQDAVDPSLHILTERDIERATSIGIHKMQLRTVNMYTYWGLIKDSIEYSKKDKLCYDTYLAHVFKELNTKLREAGQPEIEYGSMRQCIMRNADGLKEYTCDYYKTIYEKKLYEFITLDWTLNCNVMMLVKRGISSVNFELKQVCVNSLVTIIVREREALVQDKANLLQEEIAL